MITSRSAANVEDLLAAGAVLSGAWLAGAPHVCTHPGDLEWWHASAAPDEISSHLRLWDRDGTTVAWSWVGADEVEWDGLRGELAADRAVAEAVLRAADEETPGSLEAWAAEDDTETRSTLEQLGYRRGSLRLSQWQLAIDGGADEPAVRVPDGYRIRSLSGAAEIDARVEVHRAAFAPSKLTPEKYRRLVTMPHYRFEDDLVVEAPDGSLAAFAMAWWDPVARIGEFEPVGTHPDHQRRGLGRALLSTGLRRYREKGARLVQVFSRAENAASEALYEAAGFRRARFHLQFERPAR